MQPALSPLDGSSGDVTGRVVAAVPPPSNFRHWALPIHSVVSTENPYQNVSGNSAAKRAGLRYERIVQKLLNRIEGYDESPAYIVTDRQGPRLIIPDGLIRLGDFVIVVEIKIRHMPEAYWQLEHKYAPAMRWLNGPYRRVYTLEIVKSFDPAMPCPVAPRVYSSLSEFLTKPTEGFNVYVWNP